MKLLLLILLPCLLFMAPALADTSLQGFVICLDPGHTSETSAGTASRDGKLTERHLNWVVAVRLRTLLTAAGATVIMTKSREDQFVTNQKRAEIANGAHAALFLRLHADAGAATGLATFYPDRQGHVRGVTGPSSDVIRESREAARVFQPAVIAALGGALADRGAIGESKSFVGGKQGALTGSIFSHVPALTVEMCVLTNSHDYRFARTAAGQESLARALFAGVTAYNNVLHSRKTGV